MAARNTLHLIRNGMASITATAGAVCSPCGGLHYSASAVEPGVEQLEGYLERHRMSAAAHTMMEAIVEAAAIAVPEIHVMILVMMEAIAHQPIADNRSIKTLQSNPAA